MSLRKIYETNTDLEKDGIWHTFDGFKVKIARAGGFNSKLNHIMNEESKRFKREFGNSFLNDTELKIEWSANCYAKSLIKGWQTYDKKQRKYVSGIELDPGKLLPYNTENVIKVFIELPELMNAIYSDSRDAENYQVKEAAEEAKN